MNRNELSYSVKPITSQRVTIFYRPLGKLDEKGRGALAKKLQEHSTVCALEVDFFMSGMGFSYESRNVTDVDKLEQILCDILDGIIEEKGLIRP